VQSWRASSPSKRSIARSRRRGAVKGPLTSAIARSRLIGGVSLYSAVGTQVNRYRPALAQATRRDHSRSHIIACANALHDRLSVPMPGGRLETAAQHGNSPLGRVRSGPDDGHEGAALLASGRILKLDALLRVRQRWTAECAPGTQDFASPVTDRNANGKVLRFAGTAVNVLKGGNRRPGEDRNREPELAALATWDVTGCRPRAG
jgi:hypothetical protein